VLVFERLLNRRVKRWSKVGGALCRVRAVGVDAVEVAVPGGVDRVEVDGVFDCSVAGAPCAVCTEAETRRFAWDETTPAGLFNVRLERSCLSGVCAAPWPPVEVFDRAGDPAPRESYREIAVADAVSMRVPLERWVGIDMAAIMSGASMRLLRF
jgi:hypothetical protein